MKKLKFNLLLFSLILWNITSAIITEGYRYDSEKCPTGREWESPQDLSLNKELPRAWFFSFGNAETPEKFYPKTQNTGFCSTAHGNSTG